MDAGSFCFATIERSSREAEEQYSKADREANAVEEKHYKKSLARRKKGKRKRKDKVCGLYFFYVWVMYK